MEEKNCKKRIMLAAARAILICSAAAFLMLPSQSLLAQPYKLKGLVEGRHSGERVPLALIQSDKGLPRYADEAGYFSLVIPAPGLTCITAAALGYEPDTLCLEVVSDTFVIFRLAAAYLPVVEVRASARQNMVAGQLSLPVDQLKKVPVLLAEPDLIKSLQLLPGIASGVEGTTGLYVRGGSPDQNLLLLDGSTIYNPGHIFGFLSVFHPSTIGQVDVYKAYVPVEYGGRLASVIDFSMRDGDTTRHKREKSMGLISSSVALEGPLSGGKGAYLVCGRLAYSGLLTLATLPAYRQGRDLVYAGMYDGSLKLTRFLTKDQTLSLTLYKGRDSWGSRSKEVGEYGSSLIKWGNQALALRYTGMKREHWKARAGFNYGRFYNGYLGKWRTQVERADQVKYEQASTVEDWSLHYGLQWHKNGHQIKTSLEGRYQRLVPSNIYLQQNQRSFSTSLGQYTNANASLGAEYSVQIISQLVASTGLRFMGYASGAYKVFRAEPRVQLVYDLAHSGTLQVGWGRQTQFLNQINISTDGLPYDYWLPSNNESGFQAGSILFAGWSKGFNRFRLQVEAYLRRMDNMPIPVNSYLVALGNNGSWTQVLQYGRGKARGLEVLLQKDKGKLQGWLAYSLSKSLRSYDRINSGEWFPFDFDRTHDLSLTATLALGRGWTAGGNFIFQTGLPATLPQGAVRDFFGSIEVVYGERNSSRMPAYHRMDIQMVKSYTTQKKQREAKIAFGFYNVYSRNNPLALGYTAIALSATERKFAVTRSSLFTIIPNFNYTVNW